MLQRPSPFVIIQYLIADRAARVTEDEPLLVATRGHVDPLDAEAVRR